MKRFVVFFLILVISFLSRSFGCGPYYPIGDDIRFTILKPGIFNYPGYINFSYSADLYYSPKNNTDFSSPGDSVDSNIELWRRRCKYVPGYVDTFNAIYKLEDVINKPSQSNSFIEYLYKNNDLEAINYLAFAKKCNPYNTRINDPWERRERANLPQRLQLIQQALEIAKKIADKDLQLRYAFLAIRLAYYNDDFNTIKNAYSQYFSNRKSKNIIDYWGMYFRSFTETDSIKRNFWASQVFYFAPDKRLNIFRFYDENISVEKTLQYAETTDEKIAVLMMAGLKKTGKNIELLKKIYSIKPDLPGLSFMLLREVNKLEDWIYTPYYTSFNPSLEPWDYERKSYPAGRIQNDRIYAKDLLNFINSVNIKNVENPILWNILKAYLNYMTQDYATSLDQIKLLLSSTNKNNKLTRQLNILKSLCLTAGQGENAIIQDEVKPVIMNEFAAANNKFIFAIARELEYKGNSTDAAILLSKLRTRVDKLYQEGYWRNGIYWKTNSNRYTLFVDFYDDYFFYLDAQYSPGQLNDLIEDIKKSKNLNDEFSKWKYSVINKDISRLYDLLGTMYLRNNDLAGALNSFEKVSDTLWTSHYYPYSRYLDANPFYTNMFNEHSRTNADTIRYNKSGLIRNLIDYLAIAENINNNNRDYYYFLVANCYFNMTQYGNSWMMKRYYWTSNIHKTKLADDDEYFNCNLAKQYYLKAKEVSQSKRFAALCLRMAGKCEKYKIVYNGERQNSKQEITENIFYKKLQEEYPEFYDELMGNCQSFEKYFNSRN
jgi:hypothetical protein